LQLLSFLCNTVPCMRYFRDFGVYSCTVLL